MGLLNEIAEPLRKVKFLRGFLFCFSLRADQQLSRQSQDPFVIADMYIGMSTDELIKRVGRPMTAMNYKVECEDTHGFALLTVTRKMDKAS